MMLVLAVIFLLITSPWNDPAPAPPHDRTSTHHRQP
jgi:hypothetical protein